MDLSAFAELLDAQCGVVARRQMVEAGAADADIRRWVRRRELVRVHTGVYVDHTGPLSWANRAWAAVQFHWPAALSHRSAVDLAGSPIHVAVDATRSIQTRLPGVRAHRLLDLEHRVQWNLGPPRVRLEDAALAVCAGTRSRVDALALLADLCRRRRTTPARLARELQRHTRLRDRAWLSSVLGETAAGVQSVLESGYLHRVERAHGLPRGERQVRERTENGTVYRDVVYALFALVVELDGRFFHEGARQRWDDMDRDLLVAPDRLVLRLGWRQVDQDPCRTAQRLSRVFRARGWAGRPRRCGPACGIDVDLPAAS